MREDTLGRRRGVEWCDGRLGLHIGPGGVRRVVRRVPMGAEGCADVEPGAVSSGGGFPGFLEGEWGGGVGLKG